MADVDVIVVGAGNAGLTAAVTLQQAGVRTLLVERHNLPGGCATSFVRGRFEFEVALHQLSGIGHPGQPFSLRGLLEGLGVAEQLEFVEEPDLFRTAVPGQFDITLPADWDGVVQTLDDAFPGCRDSVAEFLQVCRDVTAWQVAARLGARNPEIVAQIEDGPGAVLPRLGLHSTQSVLSEYFSDVRLQSVLSSYWGYLGQPPSSLPFMDYALLLYAYLEYKPFHLRGGSQMLSSTLLQAFLDAGGTALFNTEVRRILTRNGAVAGVELDSGEQIVTDTVIANISPLVTYGRLLDSADVPAQVRQSLRGRTVGPSAFVVYLGLDADADALGFTSSSNFVSSTLDADRVAAACHSLQPAPSIMATCYDVQPIGFAPPGASTVSLVALQYADAWAAVPPDDYAAAKYAYADSMLDLAEQVFPSLRPHIEEAEVATPMTMTHYLGQPGGAIYGFEQDAEDSWLFRQDDRGAVPGLLHAGAWTGMGGFQPTLEAGVRVARRLLRAR